MAKAIAPFTAQHTNQLNMQREIESIGTVFVLTVVINPILGTDIVPSVERLLTELNKTKTPWLRHQIGL
jgi:hypothetical protein